MSTPAVRALASAGVRHRIDAYDVGDTTHGFGSTAVAALGLDPLVTGKTLVCALDDGRIVVAVVPVAHTLDMKALARAASARRATLATTAEAERATGMVVGGIAPLGHRRRLPVFVDEGLSGPGDVHVSAGRRGLEITLSGDDLVRATMATMADLVRSDPADCSP